MTYDGRLGLYLILSSRAKSLHLTIELLFYIMSSTYPQGGRREEPHVGKRHSRDAKLEMAVTAIHRRFGPNALLRGRSQRADEAEHSVPHIPTGFSSLDKLLRIGGLPKGKIVELIGQATSGKTTLALKFLTHAQQNDRTVGYIDQARYFDPDYAYRCGLDLSRLIVGTPYDVTEALAMIEALVKDGGLAALVLDTVDFLWADPSSAQHLNASLGRLTVPLAHSGTILVFLHDPLAGEMQGLDVVRHYASLRLEIAREDWLRRHGDVRGYKARIKILKSRFGPTGGTTAIEIKFNGTVHGNGL
jgi:recombination protein RecA